MSKTKPRLLPLPLDRRRGQHWATMLAFGAAFLGLPVVLFAVTLHEQAFRICMSYGVMYGAPLLISGAYMLYRRRQYLATLGEYREVARAAGLTFEERIDEARLEPYQDFTLFRLTRPRRGSFWGGNSLAMSRAGCHLFSGRFEGREVLVFEYEYQGRPGEGDKPIRRLQTVVILPDVAGLPEFDAGPMHHDWDEHWPGWARRLQLGRVVAELDTVSHEPTVVRGHDEERLRRLFGRQQVRRLGTLSECCVESVGGHVLFYAPDLDVPASGVPRALGRAVDIVRVLTEVEPADPVVDAERVWLGEERLPNTSITEEPPRGDRAAE
jgi:hypothetical protein